MALNDAQLAALPSGTTNAQALARNASDLDKILNGSGAIESRRGKQLLSVEAAIERIGYEAPIAFASGISVARSTQTVTYSGLTYHAAPSALPFTTGGSFNSSQWMLVSNVSLQDLSSTSIGLGSKLIAFMQRITGAVARWVEDKLAETVSIKDFGCAVDGVTDDTAPLALAIASGKALRVPDGICVTGRQDITQDTTFYGTGKYKAKFKSKAGANDHIFYVVGDFKLTLRSVGLDGNYANNPNLSPNNPCGVLVPVGSLDIRDCYLTGFRAHAIHTGNTDFQFGAGAYAHDVFIIDNVIDQGDAAAGLYDCIRIHRTKRAKVTGNLCTGGDSGIRSNYYCDNIDISHNTVLDSWNDVGVTLALSTNVSAVGNLCSGHAQHGIEVDGCWWGMVANNTCVGNTRNGIMVTEYGPPSGASYQGQRITGDAIAHPAIYSNSSMVIEGNVCTKNVQFGIHVIGQDGVSIVGNTIEENNTGNTNPYGLYIDGGVGHKDAVEVDGNTFRNTGYQTQSVGQANVQGGTRAGANFHTPGKRQWAFAVRGRTATSGLFSDPHLLNTANMTGTMGTIVEDTTSPQGFARQLPDASAVTAYTMVVNIPNLPAAGDKFMVIRLRTPDTMTKCTVNVNLLTGATFKYTVLSTAITTLTSDWREIQVRIPDALKSYLYDNVQVSFVTDTVLTGNLNIEEVSIFGIYEQ